MLKPSRILYVATTAQGGSAYSLYHLVVGLNKNHFEPVVLFYTKNSYFEDKLNKAGIKIIILQDQHKPNKQNDTDISNSTIIEIENRRVSLHEQIEMYFGQRVSQLYLFVRSCFQFIRHDLPKIRPILNIIRENNIEVVHLNTDLSHGKPGIIAAKLTKLPCIAHVRMFREWNLLDKFFIRFVDVFIYISKAISESCTNQGIPPNKGLIIHNGVDLNEFSQPYDAASIKSQFGWASNERLVGVVGRLDWWKGHEYFIESVGKVCQQIPELRALIIGEPENTEQNQSYLQKLKNLIKSLELEDKVIFTGFRSDIPSLMAALDVIVLSSSTPEPFGRVVIEGMAAGTPVIATAAGGVLDIIEDQVNGILVPIKNSLAISKAIIQLLNNPDQATKIAKRAQLDVQERFSIEKHVDLIQKLYHKILSTPS